jgi:integrase
MSVDGPSVDPVVRLAWISAWAATNLHTLGVPDVDIQRILRHADVKTTQQAYIKVEPSVRRAAMDKFQNALDKAKRARRGEHAVGALAQGSA